MISDHIEALFLKKQELIKLLENGTLEQILKTDRIGQIAMDKIYSGMENEIKRINSEIKACYNHNSELDNGTQFKIFDRVQSKMNDHIDPEENPLDQLMDLITSEKAQAISENDED